MALTKQDLSAIDQLLGRRFKEQNERFDKKLVRRIKEQQNTIYSAITDTLVDKILPQIDNISEQLKDVSLKTSRIERRLDLIEEDRADRHIGRIEKLEKIHPHGKHPVQI